jgi:NitT/TauT family transport system substrate-binding protein
MTSNRITVLAVALAVPLLAHLPARAEQIVVSNYTVTTNGMPFAVAMGKGFFREFKVDVDGILTSQEERPQA